MFSILGWLVLVLVGVVRSSRQTEGKLQLAGAGKAGEYLVRAAVAYS